MVRLFPLRPWRATEAPGSSLGARGQCADWLFHQMSMPPSAVAPATDRCSWQRHGGAGTRANAGRLVEQCAAAAAARRFVGGGHSSKEVRCDGPSLEPPLELFDVGRVVEVQNIRSPQISSIFRCAMGGFLSNGGFGPVRARDHTRARRSPLAAPRATWVRGTPARPAWLEIALAKPSSQVVRVHRAPAVLRRGWRSHRRK